MSEKLREIPHIGSYADIRREMEDDLAYRLRSRQARTSLGRPLYYKINVQIVVTQECPYSCKFCIERQYPMKGEKNFPAQIEALKRVMGEHPDARLTITGGEPGLYPEHVKALTEMFRQNGNSVFCSINTAGFSEELNGLGHINLSFNDYVRPDAKRFPGCTVQTIMEPMELDRVKSYMKNMGSKANSFSFRFLSGMEKRDYPVAIWNNLQADPEITVRTFRIGDFFVYATFDYDGNRARVTLGDMWQQQHNDYRDGYSNIIIHPDGRIATNWK